MEFVEGDLVMLSMHDLHMCYNCKFAAHFIGPFKVLKCIDKLAFHTKLLPIYSAIHSVFYVSRLKLYIPGVVMGLVPIYSRFWFMVKNSVKSRRWW